MKQLWAVMHFGALINYTTATGEEVKDLYTLTVKTFQDPQFGLIWVAVYTLSMLAVGFHLYHGFSSSFQSFGLNHPKYTPVIKKIGYGFAIIVPFAFAIIPIYLAFITDKI
jgi:succinate dehydrogenase / fumarate reductase, cytochrome b subunit